MTDAQQVAEGLGTDVRWKIFRNEPHNRLTLEYDGVQYRIPDDTRHNGASTPWIVRCIRYFRRDKYPWSAKFHDAAYRPGHFLWVSRDGGETWNKESVTKELADRLLEAGIQAEGGPRWVARTYFWFVDKFGGRHFHA